MYWALVGFFGFVALSAAAMILGPPASEPHVVYASAVVFIVASAGLIVSTVLAVRHRAAKQADSGRQSEPTARPTDATQREIGKGDV